MIQGYDSGDRIYTRPPGELLYQSCICLHILASEPLLTATNNSELCFKITRSSIYSTSSSISVTAWFCFDNVWGSSPDHLDLEFECDDLLGDLCFDTVKALTRISTRQGKDFVP